MWIDRILSNRIKGKLFSGKALLITGPRQVGKTSLIRHILESQAHQYAIFNADDPRIRQLLDTPNTEQIRQLIGQNRIIFIDEAQRIPNIGLTSKLIIDEFSDRQLIISGSSSFELGENMKEPLTGRKWTYNLFPICWEEWQDHAGFLKADQSLEERLIYGFYPDVISNPNDQQRILQELADSYLFKDVLNYANIRKPDVIQKLIQALAYQVGQEVSYKELGDLIGLDSKTVSHYIDILEQAFVVFRLTAFNKNLRNEIKKSRKIYFYDNGIRNAVISAFEQFPNRQDKSALWENFLISERLKQLGYKRLSTGIFFWRTKQQQEVDFVETNSSQISGYEFKWSAKKKAKIPGRFLNSYNATGKVITRENFREFVVLDEQGKK